MKPASPANPGEALSSWDRRKRVVLAMLVAAGFATSFLWLAPADGRPTLCVFRLYQGIPCPGCGLTRAVTRISHGQLGEAVQFNPLAPLVYLALLALGLRYGIEAFRGRRLALPRLAPFTRRLRPWALLGVFGFWGFRVVSELVTVGLAEMFLGSLPGQLLCWLLT